MCEPDTYRVYQLIKPRPKALVSTPGTRLLRHGSLRYYSPNTRSTKPRYFFLFNNCMLITKQKSQTCFRLKVFVHLRSNVRVIDGPQRISLEFRLVIPLQNGKARHIIMFGKTRDHVVGWINVLQRAMVKLGAEKVHPVASKNDGFSVPDTEPLPAEFLSKSTSGTQDLKKRKRKKRKVKKSVEPTTDTGDLDTVSIASCEDPSPKPLRDMRDMDAILSASTLTAPPEGLVSKKGGYGERGNGQPPADTSGEASLMDDSIGFKDVDPFAPLSENPSNQVIDVANMTPMDFAKFSNAGFISNTDMSGNAAPLDTTPNPFDMPPDTSGSEYNSQVADPFADLVPFRDNQDISGTPMAESSAYQSQSDVFDPFA